jgi:hypothetical protein
VLQNCESKALNDAAWMYSYVPSLLIKISKLNALAWLSLQTWHQQLPGILA